MKKVIRDQLLAIRNSDWTEWSIIQGVIARVISKSDEYEARGRFEITSTITPWIVRHEVQLLINRIYNKFWEKNVFWELFLSDNVYSAFPKFWKL